MTILEMNRMDLMAHVADCEATIHSRNCEIAELQAEVELANTRRDEYLHIAEDLGRTLKQLAKWSQEQRPQTTEGTI